MSKQERIEEGAKAYAVFLDAIHPDWRRDKSMIETPKRVSKMYINELFSGLDPDNAPKITTFENDGQYDGMVFQGNIEVKSVCSHHIMGFAGKAFVAYIPTKDGKIIGLSKLNRIVEYYSRRPQVQESLTMQIHKAIDELCSPNLGVAVFIKANHSCVSHRGIRQDSEMKTAKLSGDFLQSPSTREEFYKFIER